MKVTTPTGKRALAEALESHDPAFLEDLKMISGKLGPFASVEYLSRDPETQAHVDADLEAAKARHIDAWKKAKLAD